MIKTSATHPLRIDELKSDLFRGTIGLTLMPGRKGSSVAGGSWDRDLAGDLDVVCAWGPNVVLALLEDFEYARLGVPTFKSETIASGLPWLFAEIPDGGVPDTTFERAWTATGARMRAALRDGGKVLLHCRAGLGRTGLVAAMLLVEFGMEPEGAIAAVRAARPHTIETSAQEAYLRGLHALPSDS